MTDEERVANGLNVLMELHRDIYQLEQAVKVIAGMFPKVDILEALEATADRQVRRHPEANSMDLLTDHVAAEMRTMARADRRR